MKYLSKALLLVGLILCMCGKFHAAAFEQTTDVVRVGFPILAGTSYIDERGEYAGYLVDYMNQLTSFTNWDIEYVQVDGDSDTQLETLMSMLQTGEIDMLGTMNRNTTLEDMFLYPIIVMAPDTLCWPCQQTVPFGLKEIFPAGTASVLQPTRAIKHKYRSLHIMLPSTSSPTSCNNTIVTQTCCKQYRTVRRTL